MEVSIKRNGGMFDVYVNGIWTFSRTSLENVIEEIEKILATEE